jgi:hypothetical protein
MDDLLHLTCTTKIDIRFCLQSYKRGTFDHLIFIINFSLLVWMAYVYKVAMFFETHVDFNMYCVLCITLTKQNVGKHVCIKTWFHVLHHPSPVRRHEMIKVMPYLIFRKYFLLVVDVTLQGDQIGRFLFLGQLLKIL